MTHRTNRRAALAAMCALLLLPIATGACADPTDAGAALQTGPAAAPQSAPPIVIDSFASVHGLAIGDATVALVATVRNAGTKPYPGGVAFGRMYCLGGLGYGDGDTIPMIPSLAPGATVTFHWNVRPTGSDNPLVASFSLMTPGAPPVTKLLAIPHIASEPAPDPPPPAPVPVARASKSTAVLENGRVQLRIVRAPTGMPIGFLWARAGAGWQRVGTVTPFAELLSAEDAQDPWWEFFRVTEMRASSSATSASLALTGAFGLRWRATIVLSLGAGAGATEARLQFAAARPLHLVAIRLCPLLAGDGGLGGSPAGSERGAASGPNTISAMRWGPITAGALRPAAPAISGWTVESLPDRQGVAYHVVGWEARDPDSPQDAAPGTQFSTRMRLFALYPTRSVADANHLSFTDPPVRVQALAQASRSAAHPRKRVVTRAQRSKARAAALRKARHHRTGTRRSVKRSGRRSHAKHHIRTHRPSRR